MTVIGDPEENYGAVSQQTDFARLPVSRGHHVSDPFGMAESNIYNTLDDIAYLVPCIRCPGMI